MGLRLSPGNRAWRRGISPLRDDRKESRDDRIIDRRVEITWRRAGKQKGGGPLLHHDPDPSSPSSRPSVIPTLLLCHPDRSGGISRRRRDLSVSSALKSSQLGPTDAQPRSENPGDQAQRRVGSHDAGMQAAQSGCSAGRNIEAGDIFFRYNYLAYRGNPVKIPELKPDETNALLAAIVDSSDDAIVSKTLEGIITSWNRGAERMFGYDAAEAIGKNIRLIIPPERQAEEDNVLKHIRRGEKIEHFETVRQSKDGRRVDISLTVSPVKDGQGRIIGASKVARDIIATKADEAGARTADDTGRGRPPNGGRSQPAEGRLSSDSLARAAQSTEFDRRLGGVAAFGQSGRENECAGNRGDHASVRKRKTRSSTICSMCRASSAADCVLTYGLCSSPKCWKARSKPYARPRWPNRFVCKPNSIHEGPAWQATRIGYGKSFGICSPMR